MREPVGQRDLMEMELIDLYKSSSVKKMTGLAGVIDAIDVKELTDSYLRRKQSAPSRHTCGKSYLDNGHKGVKGTKPESNRREEHLAGALWLECRHDQVLVTAGGMQLRVLDYQVPLKARGPDKGFGKVDLCALLNDNQFGVIELKVLSRSGNSDSPLAAYLEGLAYSAVIEANAAGIATEIDKLWGIAVPVKHPKVVVMAPEDYWEWCFSMPEAHNWWHSLKNLARTVEQPIGVQAEFLVLTDLQWEMGTGDEVAYLTSPCVIRELEGLADSLGVTDA